MSRHYENQPGRYGASELKATYQRNISLAFALVIVAILILLPVLPDRSESLEGCPSIPLPPIDYLSGESESPFVNRVLIMPEGESRKLIIDGWIGFDRDEAKQLYLQVREANRLI